jgi:hypothetical protein
MLLQYCSAVVVDDAADEWMTTHVRKKVRRSQSNTGSFWQKELS